MLEFLIHGTKYGWRVLYKTPNFPSSFASDLRREDVNNDRVTVGKHAYSISHVSEGCIFSKYLCVWDADRRAIGNLSFSIFIQKDKNLNCEDIICLLDELSGLYWSQYVTEGELSNKQENWLMFETILKKYENKIQNLPYEDIEVSVVGSGDAAFIYYNDENQLLQYIESPHQKEYQYHKQVFLVSNSLNGFIENPLNVLRHNQKANLTGQIDLNNHKYRLLIPPLSESNIKIEVRSKDKTVFNNGFLRIKSEIEIIWTKPFHVSQRCTGNIFELSSSFLTFDDLNRTIKIKEIYLNAKKHTFRFNPVNEYKKPIIDCEIILKCDKFNIDRKASNNEITLTAEEVSSGVNVFVKRLGVEHKILMLSPQLEGDTILLEIPKNNNGNNDRVSPKGKGSGRQNLIITLICLVSIIILILSLVLFYPEEKVDTSPDMTEVDGKFLIRSQLNTYQSKLNCNIKIEPNTIHKIFPFLFKDNFDNKINKEANCNKINLYISIFDDLKNGKIDSLKSLVYLQHKLDSIDLKNPSIRGSIKNLIETYTDTIYLDTILNLLKLPLIIKEGNPNKNTETKDLELKLEVPKEGTTIKQGKNEKPERKDIKNLLDDRFWVLVSTSLENPQKKSFDGLLDEYEKNNNKGPIMLFLVEICGSTKEFDKKFIKIPKGDRSKAAEDRNLDLLKTSTPQ